jgi:hypothetical protein
LKDRIVRGSLLLACLCSGAAGQSLPPDPAKDLGASMSIMP